MGSFTEGKGPVDPSPTKMPIIEGTTSPPDSEASSLYCNCRSGLGADDLVVPAIKQALSMLGQAREALIFAQCPTAVPKSDRLSSQHWVHFVPPSGACRSPVRAWGNSGSFSFLASNPCSGTPSRGWTQILELSSHTAIQLVAVLDPLEQAIVDAAVSSRLRFAPN